MWKLVGLHYTVLLTRLSSTLHRPLCVEGAFTLKPMRVLRGPATGTKPHQGDRASLCPATRLVARTPARTAEGRLAQATLTLTSPVAAQRRVTPAWRACVRALVNLVRVTGVSTLFFSTANCCHSHYLRS